MGQCYRIARKKERQIARNVGGEQGQTSATNATDHAVTSSGDDARIEIISFSFSELRTATNNFRPESFIARQGRFGRMYRGNLKNTGQNIAVRKLNSSGMRKFDVEVRMLSVLRHPNIVNLIGSCAERNQRLVVYEFMPLGSLKSHFNEGVHKARALDWNKRMKIAAGVATVLNYLHNEVNPSVIFKDLKSTNILLDEGFHPKLSDFGDAKFATEDDDSSSHPMAMDNRAGYAAPEYAAFGKHTIKSDVYNFGILMLELISGSAPSTMTQGNRKHRLIDSARAALASEEPGPVFFIADSRLTRNFSEYSLRRALEVTLTCVADDPESRPDMNVMVEAFNLLATASSASASASAAENPEEKGGDGDGDGDGDASDGDGTLDEETRQMRRMRRSEKRPMSNQ